MGPETSPAPANDVSAENAPTVPAALREILYPAGGLKDSYAVLRARGASPAEAAAQVGPPRPRPLAKTRPRA